MFHFTLFLDIDHDDVSNLSKGFYIMHDAEEEAILGLPQGDYDIPMALTSKRYNNDGTLWSPEKNNEEKNLFGDVVHVNGQPWPYFKVEPRKYRLRFLNAAISRSWELYLESAAKAKVNMKVRPDPFVTIVLSLVPTRMTMSETFC